MSHRHLSSRGRPIDAELAYREGHVTLTDAEGGRREYRAVHLGGPEWVLVDDERRHRVLVAWDGTTAWVHADGRTHVLEPAARVGGAAHAATGDGRLTAPMPATVLELLVTEGAVVAAGQTVAVISAMKMRIDLKSPIDGVVRRLPRPVESSVDLGEVVAVIEPEDPAP